MNYWQTLAEKLKALLDSEKITYNFFIIQIDLLQEMALEGVKAHLYVVDYWEARCE